MAKSKKYCWRWCPTEAGREELLDSRNNVIAHGTRETGGHYSLIDTDSLRKLVRLANKALKDGSK